VVVCVSVPDDGLVVGAVLGLSTGQCDQSRLRTLVPIICYMLEVIYLDFHVYK